MANVIRLSRPWFVLMAVMLSWGSVDIALGADEEIVFEHKKWQGVKYFSKKDHTYSRCLAEVYYHSNIELGLGWNLRDNFEIWLENDSWDMVEGETYTVRIKVDDFTALYAEAYASYPQGVLIVAPQENWLFEKLKKGKELTIFTEAETFEFELTDSFVALDKIEKCHLAAMKAEGKSVTRNNPFAVSTKRSSKKDHDRGDDNMVKNDEETASFVQTLMMTVPLRHFSVRDEDEKPDSLRNFPIVWDGPSSFGFGFRLKGASLNEVSNDFMSSVMAHCSADFQTSRHPFSLPQNQRGLNIAFACIDEDPVYETFSFYPSNAGGYVVIANAGITEEDAQEADEAFKAAIIDYKRGY